MAGWLTKAKQVFNTPEPRAPERYQLSCACGEEVGGERTDREQRATCPTCDLEMFVLPESVYPPPRARPPRPPVRKRQLDALPPEDSVEVDDEQEATVEETSQAADKEERPEQEVVVDKVRGIHHPRSRGRRIFTPLRITAVGILFVLALTAYFEIRSRNMTKAQSQLTEASKAGQQALEDRDLNEAMRQFTQVADALDILGRDDKESRQLQQLSQEVFAINDLNFDPIEAMIESAVAAGGQNLWTKQFERQYQGKWIVLETALAEVGTEETLRINFPTSMQGEEVTVLIARSSLPIQNSTDTNAVILAGQLQSVKPSGASPRVWEISLSEESTFLWANRSTYEFLGFQPDEETVATLAEQKRLVEVEP